MKRIMVAAVAASMFATPAFAASEGPTGSGGFTLTAVGGDTGNGIEGGGSGQEGGGILESGKDGGTR